jgi:hypothetical protein
MDETIMNHGVNRAEMAGKAGEGRVAIAYQYGFQAA